MESSTHMTIMQQPKQLRSEHIASWIRTDWIPRYPHLTLMTTLASRNPANHFVVGKLDRAMSFEGYRFERYEPIECPVVELIDDIDLNGTLRRRMGAFVFHFTPDPELNPAANEPVEALLVVCQYADGERHDWVALACIPTNFTPAWGAFEDECNRLNYAYERQNRVEVIGGRHDSFIPTVEWDEIILPESLKTGILDDVRSFFAKGVEVYRRLNLKPFRKLLFAGVPGTGKTMLCNALAKWALAQDYLVIYISSAQRGQNDRSGSNFGKIQRALDIASSSAYPTMIILEELDAYLPQEEKALILNVLDGSESVMNDAGTLLIATTNYPEAIDERILKRPGRLDRVIIVPQTKTENDAGAMLKRYLGSMWQDVHYKLVPKLVGYPGAFIREVAIYALTQVAYDDLPELPLSLLIDSFERLKAQIDARDNFLKQRAPLGFGSDAPAGTVRTNGNHD